MPCWGSPCRSAHFLPHDPSPAHPEMQNVCYARIRQWEPAGFRAEVYQFPLSASPQAFDAASLEKRRFFFSLLIQLLEKNALTELCQVTQSISGENQPELVREAADLHSGKMSEGSNPGQAVLERGALLELGPACCCTPCLGPLGTQGVCRS